MLARRGLVAFSAEATVIENRCDQSGGQVVERAADQIVELIGARAELGGQGQCRQHGRASDFDVSFGGGQLCFGACDVRTMGEQLAGHAGGDIWPLQVIEGLCRRQLLHRSAEQGGEADQRVLGLLLHARQLPLLGGDQALLLRQFQRGG